MTHLVSRDDVVAIAPLNTGACVRQNVFYRRIRALPLCIVQLMTIARLLPSSPLLLQHETLRLLTSLISSFTFVF